MNILNLVVRDRDGREAALNFPVRRLLMAGFTVIAVLTVILYHHPDRAHK